MPPTVGPRPLRSWCPRSTVLVTGTNDLAGGGLGVVTRAGRMVEALHVEVARRMLAAHEAARATNEELA